MYRPKILFAEELAGKLDAESAKNIIRLIFDLNGTAGTTLMLVTHDQDLSPARQPSYQAERRQADCQ